MFLILELKTSAIATIKIVSAPASGNGKRKNLPPILTTKQTSALVRLSGIGNIQAIIKNTDKTIPVIANVTLSYRPVETPSDS